MYAKLRHIQKIKKCCCVSLMQSRSRAASTFWGTQRWTKNSDKMKYTDFKQFSVSGFFVMMESMGKL